MSAARSFLAAALFLLAAPGWAQGQSQPASAQSASAQSASAQPALPAQSTTTPSTSATMQPSLIGDLPLSVTLTTPTAGQQFMVGSSMPLGADADDPDVPIRLLAEQVDCRWASEANSQPGRVRDTAYACRKNQSEVGDSPCKRLLHSTSHHSELP